VALPFWKMTITVPKPLKIIVLTEISHIGLHIRKRRLELKLTLEEAAAKLGIGVVSLCKWEKGKVIPREVYTGSIIQFLGYSPYSLKTETFGQRIKAYRLLHGYNLGQFRALFGVSECTLISWEADETKPRPENLGKLNALLNTE
jgi:transcriptional regulator with XRE-family HTH domain